MLPDFLPALEYVLADKAKRGQQLRAVFLLLDIDTFGDPAATNRYIETLQPRALSGGSGVVLLVEQSDGPSGQELAAYPVGGPGSDRGERSSGSFGPREGEIGARPFCSAERLGRARLAGRKPHNRPFRQRAHFAEQLQLLQRIAALSRQSGAELIVAVSPLHRAVESRYLPKDLSQALDQVARIAPLWDFTGADWLSDDPNYWMGDTAHYSSEVGRMMLARIFGDPMPRGWERFGRLRGG